ncbi:hypothetical protein [Pontivivens ytuae]|uniref:Uncharacterized protein n=1 Tax=Pontivivens ytuae TaxID=2789856 RepID=A0A7S9LR64_9RHOB|nr:hypothetical protein [Pontivivens ytuae]QPH53743.1 hypothetical protein I0K15_18500 [Pontivivens ytuae]
MRRTALTAAVACLLAAPAVAECPAQAPLERDVFVAYDDGHFTQLQPDTHPLWSRIVSGPLDGSEPPREYVVIGGLLTLQSFEGTGDARRLVWANGFDMDPATLFPLGPGERHELTSRIEDFTGNNTLLEVLTSPTRGPSHKEVVTIETGPERERDVAGCRYEGFDVTVTYDPVVEEEIPFVSHTFYIPAMRVEILIAYQYLDPGADLMEVVPLSISHEAPL